MHYRPVEPIGGLSIGQSVGSTMFGPISVDCRFRFLCPTFYVHSCANSRTSSDSFCRSGALFISLDAVQTDRIMLVICSFESSNLFKHSSILLFRTFNELNEHLRLYTTDYALLKEEQLSSSINCLTGRTCLLKAHLLSFLSSAFRRAT